MSGNNELRQLADDLANGGKLLPKFARKAVQVTAQKVRDDWRNSLEGAPALPHAARSITYDIESDSDGVEADIGPEPGRRQARFVTVVEYGSPTLGPRGYGHAALQRNEQDFYDGIDKAIEDSLNALGL